MSNHYEVLGISKDADDSDIKKAYRKLSLQYHPDRNPSDDANARFQEINEAFEVLSDPEKRNQYNMELQFGQRGPNPFEHDMHDINNIFNMMFGGGGPGGNPFGGMPGMPGVRIFHGGGGPGINIQTQVFHSFSKPEPINVDINITIEQSYHGCTVPLKYDCWNVVNNVRSNETRSLQINLPKGVDDGETLLLQDQGNGINNQVRGDVRVTIRIQNSSEFTRKGMDLYLHKRVSLKDALCGFNFEFDHFNGKRICMNNATGNNVIKPNTKKVINGLGMVKDNGVGNLVVEFDVSFPESITDEQRETIKKIL
jgi:DnaJ-class molecular chaperone